MLEKKKSFVSWAKEHKTEIIIGGIGIGTAIGLYLIIRDDSLVRMCKPTKAVIKNKTLSARVIEENSQKIIKSAGEEVVSTIPMLSETMKIASPIDVSGHFRTLHEGWKASEKKIAEAAALGLELLPGQTIVDAYKKGGVAA